MSYLLSDEENFDIEIELLDEINDFEINNQENLTQQLETQEQIIEVKNNKKKENKELKTTNLFCETLNEAKLSMNKINGFSYLYKWKNSSTNCTTWLYQCRSHENCEHQLRICQHLKEEVNSFEILESGKHIGAAKSFNFGINKQFKEAKTGKQEKKI